jgi:hypothetical protein
MTLIKCDFDGDLPSDIEYRIGRLCDQMGWIVETHGGRTAGIEMRRTKRGWHVIIDLHLQDFPALPEPVQQLLIVVAQLYLGSDRERELFNAMRTQNWDLLPEFWKSRWNVLYGEHVKGVD